MLYLANTLKEDCQIFGFFQKAVPHEAKAATASIAEKINSELGDKCSANTARERKNHMNLNAYKEKVIETVIEPMISFMELCEEDGCAYTTDDIEACKSLIYTYLEALAAMTEPSDDTIMAQVKTLVLELNDLNEKVDYALIETEAREAIWEVIQTSAIDCGLQEYGDDITEEWREW